MSAIKIAKPPCPCVQRPDAINPELPPSSGTHHANFIEQARVEAERRSTFIRGMGSSLVGYSDGYADGFEQAAQWFLGNLSNPLMTEYRPGAGMNFTKEYYKNRPKERKSILEWFEKLATRAKEKDR